MNQTPAPTDRIAIDGSDANLTRHFAGAEGAYRIKARINAYRNQSTMVLARWDGTTWQTVTALTGAEITTWEAANSARIRKTFTASDIDDDLATLMTEATFITGDVPPAPVGATYGIRKASAHTTAPIRTFATIQAAIADARQISQMQGGATWLVTGPDCGTIEIRG